jgi:hypothetical protein
VTTITQTPALSCGHDQLTAELALLDLLLEREVVRLRDSGLYVDSDFRGLYVADEQVDAVLRGASGMPAPLRSAREIELGAMIDAHREALRAAEEAALAAGASLPLTELQREFGLGEADRALLVMGLACELDLRYELLFAYAQNDVTRKRPTVELALRLICDDLAGRARLRGRLTPSAPLLRHELLTLVGDPQDPAHPLLARYLKPEGRIVDFVLGVEAVDARLAPFTRLVEHRPARAELVLHPDVAAALPGLVASLRERAAVVLLQGPYGSGRAGLAAAVAGELDRPLIAADMRGALRNDECCIGTVFGLLAREARLSGAALLLENFELLFDDETRAPFRARAVAAKLATCGAPVFLASSNPWHPPPPWPDAGFVTLALGQAPYQVRLDAWRAELARVGTAGEVDAAELAGKFGLTPGQVRDAVRDATYLRGLGGRPGGDLTSDDLHAAARRQSAHELGQYAQRIEPQRSWHDIVVSPKVLRELREVELHVRHRAAVSTDWGFDRRLSLGEGVTVLFAGPSGTGKTLAAEILARELRLELFKIDLSAVVSKYIGETEKQLEKVFGTARNSNAIVFFDEADATFGKRSEVADAHDRYANIEVAYLLQKIEEYDGVVVLATNLRRNMDEAFARRMQHTIEFSLPRAAERRRILDLLLPRGMPVADDVDLDFLAEHFELTGGNLRNVAVTAAFLATHDGTPITMRHLVLGTARELEKTNRLPTRSDFGPYYRILHETLAGTYP